jgi:phosphomannomutase
MHGAGAGYVRRLLDGGSTRVLELHGERNPGFGGMHPEPIARHMPEALHLMTQGPGYDLGIANDGDADRVGIIAPGGRFVDQLEVMALLCMYLLERRGMRGPLVRSQTSSQRVDRLAEQFGVTVLELPVGFKHIGPKMIEVDALIGGEESGGFGFRGHLPERDGILAGLLIAEMIVDYGLPLPRIRDHLEELVGPHAYARHDIVVDRDSYGHRKVEIRRRLREDPPASLAGSTVIGTRTDDGLKMYLEDGSWAMVRLSGTEPLIRLYSEASSPARVDQVLDALHQYLQLPASAAAGAHP